MARPTRTSSPLSSTSFRISDRAKFAARFLARTAGVSDAIAVEKAISDAADKSHASMSWRELWDEEESVRTLRLWALPEFKPSTESASRNETERVAFVAAHAQFFYRDKARLAPDRARAMILWEHVPELEHLWRTKRTEDYHCAAKEMVKILRRAKLDAPAFG